MKIVVFGLTVSSSWGNGHATLWRGLIRALDRLGHRVVFFERDVDYYAHFRDLRALPGASELVLYPDWTAARERAAREVADADVAMTTSYCPDAVAAAALIAERAPAAKLFYDLDTPVTLAKLAAGEHPAYLPAHGLGDFDLVLSYTGGAALDALRDRLGAREAVPLYGHADPEQHRPGPPDAHFAGDLSYLGTYAGDRQNALRELFIEPAKLRPAQRFVLGGSGYPEDFPWTDNIFFVRHLPPPDHPSFFSSSRLTLNITRADMAAMGWCPSGRLFEAALCGCPLLSDDWEGLDRFFVPGEELLIARTREDSVAALDLGAAELAAVARRARERVLAEHTSEHRARALTELVRGIAAPQRAAAE
ncbi:MAG: Spore_germination_protein_CgeB [uncultured Sphingomonadaceae bacterium]|uniref:Spore_germination_protein_CgeB n=1 Tax=uncultured Sphingomonadaceae bacterium TaxID=169976 RepID=A0A6J4S6I7_9SPHN|nr:MAG: Spore_germination_protein_CgeB [uncultured Sphingomonadaceae bacterium]